MDNRIRELDGIRGIAILLVMCTHLLKRANYLTGNAALIAFGEIFRIGWVGVDLFFVLSGYLITSILLKTRQQEHYYKNFYARRILRIFPLYYVTLLITFPLLVWLDKNLGPETRANWPIFLVYLQNWLYVFGREPSNVVGVTWSLAIEEQFYLLWPFIVKKLERRQLVQFIFGFLLFILAARIGLIFVARQAINLEDLYYYASFIRFDGLLMGALLALALTSDFWREWVRRRAGWFFWASLAALTLMLVSGPPSANFANLPLMTAGYSLLAVFFAACLALALTGEKNNPLRWLFANRGLIFFGKYSYALYLFHLPVGVFLLNFFWASGRKNAAVWLTYTALAFGITILLALLSWNLLEKRVLRLKRYFE
ncbi:MAG: acyltransferase [Anaerolineales bacterium]